MNWYLTRNYETDFAEMWATGNINWTGANDLGTLPVDDINDSMFDTADPHQ